MADNYIPIDQNRRLGIQLRRLVDLTREVLDLHEKVRSIMDNQTDGANYGTLEKEFGLPSGKGQLTYTLVTDSLAVIDKSGVRQLVEWLG